VVAAAGGESYGEAASRALSSVNISSWALWWYCWWAGKKVVVLVGVVHPTIGQGIGRVREALEREEGGGKKGRGDETTDTGAAAPSLACLSID